MASSITPPHPLVSLHSPTLAPALPTLPPVGDPPSIPPSKPSSSRYDYIKVRIHSGPHYHVLSRYLLARRLSFTLLPSTLCVHIALRIKKQCVDTGRLDLHRDELDALITAALTSSLPPHVQPLTSVILTRWRLVCSFADRRLPLLVLLLGTRGVGKSGLARRLANRLSIPSVIQTSSVLTLCNSLDGHSDVDSGSAASAEWTWSGGLSDDAVDAEQQRRCSVVRSALQHDISKCVNEGRSLLIEGSELDCSLYEHAKLQDTPSPACIVLAFVLSVDSNEQRILLHDSLASTDAPADVAVKHVERLQRWMDKRVEQQKQAWQRWKAGGEADGELPLVPQIVPVSLRSASSAVSSMHTAVLNAISHYVSDR